jgi:hypothetical protein
MLQNLHVLRGCEEVGLHDEAVHEADGRGAHFRLQLPEQEVANVLVVQGTLLGVNVIIIVSRFKN